MYTSPKAKHLIDAGAGVGINFTFKCDRVPSTLHGHCALEFALLEDGSGIIQNKLKESLFETYFVDGNVLTLDCVVLLGANAGLDSVKLKEYISNEDNLKAVREKAIMWSQRGVSGVPFFIMNGIKTFSGAQDVHAFQQMFDRIAERFPMQQNL
jgi:predicted DsbA family dithiol-disulfide isomerase